MKNKLQNLKNTVVANKAEIAVAAAVTAFTGLLVYATIQEEKARQEQINTALAEGRTVLDTPYGPIII